MKRSMLDDTYIFGKDTLHVFKFGFPFIGLILCGFSLVFLPQAIHSSNNRGAGIICTVFFIALGLFFILLSKRFVNMAAMHYSLTEHTAINHNNTTITVSTKLPLYASLLSLSFNAKGGRTIDLPVYLLSNTPIPYIPLYKTGALGLAKKVIDLGIVVLPVNEKTTAWIQQTINITPAVYPKISYIQKK